MVDLVRRQVVDSAHTVVVKIGTNVLTGTDGQLDLEHLAHLTHQLATIKKAGRNLVVVSSGAIGAGMGRLGLAKRPTALPELQAAAAVGQSQLMNAYDRLFSRYDLPVAQILLTAEDFNDRGRYLNTRNTILQVLKWNAIPIINENDTISVAEIKFGDNDALAAHVTNLIQAPLLVILSVVDGLYPGDYRVDPTLKPIDKILDVDDDVLGLAQTSTSGLGTGGMRSKLQSARMATSSGENVWIANGKRPNVLVDLLAGASLGTLLVAKGEPLAAWKRWIGYSVKPKGAFIVDNGARGAVVDKCKSLLPVGVVDVTGDFEIGDVVALECPAGVPFGRGLTNYSANEARKIVGLASNKVAEILPGCRYEEVVHRDNLVIL